MLSKQNITTLKGVGEKRAALFEKIGAPTVGALLRLYPRAYENWQVSDSISEAPVGEVCTVCARVLNRPTEHRIRKGMTLYKVTVTDDESDLLLTFFNNRFVQNLLLPGETYLFRGRMNGSLLRKEMTSPEFLPQGKAAQMIPVYPQTEGLTSRQIASAVQNALLLLPDPLHDPLPYTIRQQYELCHLRFAMWNIHRPPDESALAVARRRLIFEELLVLQLGLWRLKSREKAENTCPLEKDYTAEFEKLLPYTLTGAQKRAIHEAVADMRGDHPMNRLVQGDVGSGKTAVAAALCYTVVKNGRQAALMAPTEILAAQHFESLSKMYAGTGVRVALLTGSLTPAKRRKLLEELESGEIDLAVGTHALITDTVRFRNLSLVVTDEQHRFGVEQRTALAEKGEHAHMLVMSATPIPRTLALMIYGDLDLSILDERPPGRQPIASYRIDSSKRQRAYGYIRRHIEEGRQGYIICPLVEESESDMASVTEYTRRLREEVFPDLRIGMLHGKMKPKEKDAVMTAFAAGELDLLVSTTVVEVGVDVPNAVIMLIENAERYGLSQLHQLRGRIGRGKYPSTCIFLSDARGEEANERLKIMCSTDDGFKIADEDLRLRGPGDFFGSRQHGLPQLRIANMADDIEVLRQAQACAKALLAEDPELSAAEHRGLRAEVRQLFEQAENLRG